MKRAAIGICLLAALSGAAVAAQLYRWVDEKGGVEWRDTPPPPSVKKFEQRRIDGGGGPQDASLPYSLQQAMKTYPVTLWTAQCGVPCDQAREHLAKRGIPHTVRDAQGDVETFQKATGGNEIPVLYVGTTRLKGYLDTDWDTALDVAGYPKTAFTIGGKPVVKPVVVPAAKPEPQAAPQTEGQPEGQPAAPAQ